jgi:hypothetical protein
MMPRPFPQVSLFAAAAFCAVLTACGGDNLSLPDLTEPAQLQAVSGTGQAGSVGTLLADPLVVRVLDSQDRPVPNIKVAFAAGSGAAGSTVEPDTAQSDGDGRASVRWALGSAPGGQILLAHVVGRETVSASFTAMAGAGVAQRIEKVSGDNQTATAGSPLPDSLIVRALDTGGQPVAGISVNWVAEGGGSVSAPSTVTRADGTTGVRRTLGPVAGQQATSAALPEASAAGLSFSAVAVVGTAGALRIEVQPASTASSGAAFNRQPQLQLIDGNNNPVPQAGLAVSAQLGSGPAGAVLTGSTTASTNAQGLAVFTNLGISGPGGSYTLDFSGPGASGATSTAIQVSAGEAVKLAMVTQPPATVQTGAALTPAPVVRLEDGTGNGVAASGVPVTVSLVGDGSLGGTLTVNTDAGGQAAFPGLTISAISGDRMLLFAGNGLQSVASTTIHVVNPPDGTRSSIETPASAVAGVAAAVTVTVRDASGMTLPGITVTLQSDGTDNTITPSSATSDVSGVASFTVSSTVAQQKSLSATADGVTIGPASLLVIPGEGVPEQTTADVPSEGKAGRTVKFTVTVRDQYGNQVLAGGANIQASIPGFRGLLYPFTVTDQHNGTYAVSYKPGTKATDSITVTMNGTQIKGSPFTIVID